MKRLPLFVILVLIFVGIGIFALANIHQYFSTLLISPNTSFILLH